MSIHNVQDALIEDGFFRSWTTMKLMFMQLTSTRQSTVLSYVNLKLPNKNYRSKAYRIDTYCGVAPRGRSIERPLLINGYAYLAVSLLDNGRIDSNS
jgi:hypothetical protein